jgi:hypothetical protein
MLRHNILMHPSHFGQLVMLAPHFPFSAQDAFSQCVLRVLACYDTTF